MSEESFDYVMNGQFRFANPKKWNNPFESLMVEGDYSKLDFQQPVTYAVCFTQLHNSEAHWKIYTNSPNNCLRIEYDLGKLIDTLFFKYGEKFYIGEVFYDLIEKSIKSIGSKRSKYHRLAIPKSFNDNDYVVLLLLKRRAFKWEKEIRIIILDKHKQEDYCVISFNPIMAKLFIKSIQISPTVTTEEVERLRDKYNEWWNNLICQRYFCHFLREKGLNN